LNIYRNDAHITHRWILWHTQCIFWFFILILLSLVRVVVQYYEAINSYKIARKVINDRSEKYDLLLHTHQYFIKEKKHIQFILTKVVHFYLELYSSIFIYVMIVILIETMITFILTIYGVMNKCNHSFSFSIFFQI